MHNDRKGMRKAAANKAMRMVSADPHQKVDASSWSPPEAMEPGVKTGMRPISPRQFKRGGKVADMEGAKAMHHVGRKPRKSGGAALSADSLINRNVKEANEKREGKKHVGGMKSGGLAGHPDVKEDKALIKSMIKPSAIKGKLGGGSIGANPVSAQAEEMGKAARKHGGKVHKKARGGPEGDFSPRMVGKDEIGQMIENLPKNPPMGSVKAKPDVVPVPKPVPGRPKVTPEKLPPGFVGAKSGGKVDHGDDCRCEKCWGGAATEKGGREARKRGGRTKHGKTHINIMIAPHSKDDSMGRPPMAMPARPVPMPAPAPMPMGGAPMGGGMPALPPTGAMPMRPPMGGLPMGRKHGGKVEHSAKPIHVIDNAAGGGLGRLEKIKAYGKARG